jgi:hypothetical protein
MITQPNPSGIAGEGHLGDKLTDLAALNDDERGTILAVIDAVTMKNKLQTLTGNTG